MTRRFFIVFLGLLTLGVSPVGCGDDSGNSGSDASVGDDANLDDAGAGDADIHQDGGSTPDATSDPDGSTPPPTGCGPMEAPTGETVEVHPTDADTLRDIVMSAEPGTTILLHDGTYDMSGGDTTHRLSFYTDGVTLRSYSGVPENVVLDGGYVTGELVSIAASDTTIAEVTLTRAYYHPIHITGASDRDIETPHIYRVRIIDPGEQAIKINPSAELFYADRGVIECSHIELTDSGRPEIRNNCYTGGVDAHAAWDWEIRDNTIIGFWCDAGLSEHGIHLWRTCRGTLVERNHILDCARGIGFGLSATAGGNVRTYPDDPYPSSGYMDHIDGVIRNNFISASNTSLYASSSGVDSGISLAQARGAQVYHNTVAFTDTPFCAIEWRFENTDAVIMNNLVTHNLMPRNGAQAALDGNLEGASLDLFLDGAGGDLHVDPGAPGANSVLGSGAALTPGLCDEDIDGETRNQPPDIGADEVD